MLKLRLDWPRLLGHNSVYKVDEISGISQCLKRAGPTKYIGAVIKLKEDSKSRVCPLPTSDEAFLALANGS